MDCCFTNIFGDVAFMFCVWNKPQAENGFISGTVFGVGQFMGISEIAECYKNKQKRL